MTEKLAKVEFGPQRPAGDQILQHWQAQMKAKLLSMHLQKVYRATIPQASEGHLALIDTQPIVTKNYRNEEPLTKETKTLKLCIVIEFCDRK